MDNKIVCDCGITISKACLTRHKKSKSHFDKLKMKQDETQDDDECDEETINEHQEIESSQETEENVNKEVEEVKETKKSNKSGKSKEYMDMIRQKAHETIRRKKQNKIDQENMIKEKAEQYDILVKSLKEKEELEKKKKEEDKIKEMEHKSKEYDKMVRQQERNQVISNLTQGKIIDDIKEQRLNYLMKYLNNPNHF